MLKHRIGDGVVVKREYGGDVPQIEAVPSELNQVWTNLITNAIDAVDGKGTLRIATRAEPEFVVVEIADDGPGMPPDVQALRSSRSSRPRTSARAPGSVSTSRGGSSPTATTVRS